MLGLYIEQLETGSKSQTHAHCVYVENALFQVQSSLDDDWKLFLVYHEQRNWNTISLIFISRKKQGRDLDFYELKEKGSQISWTLGCNLKLSKASQKKYLFTMPIVHTSCLQEVGIYISFQADKLFRRSICLCFVVMFPELFT